jgi:hypothetical protein
MLFKDDVHAFLKEGDFVHEEGEVELLRHFLTALVIIFHLFPRDFYIDLF